MQQLFLAFTIITHIAPTFAMQAPEQPDNMNREHAIQIPAPQPRREQHPENRPFCVESNPRAHYLITTAFIVSGIVGVYTGYHIGQGYPTPCYFNPFGCLSISLLPPYQ